MNPKYLLLILLPLAMGMHRAMPESTSLICSCDDASFPEFKSTVQAHHGSAEIDRLNPRLGYYRVRLIDSRRPSEVVRAIEQFDGVAGVACYEDHKVSLRATIPDDPLWGEQWDMQIIDLPQAWDLSKGGLTALGDTIVIAILDAGYNVSHPDIQDAIWVNRGEIPNDGQDNDLNGYTDDYKGLNLDSGDDQHPLHFHGAGVSGIIGATGNNDTGICGSNWNIKLLFISGIAKESDIIEGYNYVRALRDLYEDSNGAEGAFIVATNLSAGLDGAFAEDHPLWCAAYDDLGESGIISIASTTNSDTNVDEDGDMPSTCQSDYLIMVTNTTIDDVKMAPAGYGKIHIDLGAPGTRSKSLDLGNEYQDFPGTSAAAPHVSGVVGLLYSSPCPDFAELARTTPSEAAMFARTAILEGVDLLEDLEEYTATGGRLNALKSLEVIQGVCSEGGSDLQILSASPNPTIGEATIVYNAPEFTTFRWYIFDASGRLVANDADVPIVLQEATRTWDFTNYPAGVYFILVEGAGQKSSWRVVVP